jgi:hypothetical protein
MGLMTTLGKSATFGYMKILPILLASVAALLVSAPCSASPVRLDFTGTIQHVNTPGVFTVGELLKGTIFYDTAVAPEAKNWLFTEYPVGQTTIDYGVNGLKPGDFSDTSADAIITSTGALSFVGVDYDKKDGLTAFALLLTGKFPTTSLPDGMLGIAGTLYGKWADDCTIVLFDAAITSLKVTQISAVPLPGAFLLFGSGLLTLLGGRRVARRVARGGLQPA